MALIGFWENMDLFEEVYRLTRQIPQGKVSTYGAIARALGDIRAARGVGTALNLNPDPEGTPCYRVVNSDGTLGGFSRGLDDKIRRLKRDGLEIAGNRIKNFEEHLFEDFDTEYPLKKLRGEQIKLQNELELKDDFDDIDEIVGIDVAYSKRNGRYACAAYVVVDLNCNILDKGWIFGKVNFPYIPTYLAYRELPLILKLFDSFNIKASLAMIDGNGILHPYRMGIASHVGIILKMPAIGVAKNLLFGRLENDTIKDKRYGTLGKAIYSSKRPIFVSPGNKISIETSARIVKSLCRYRIPEPIRWAHIVAKSKIAEQDLQI